MSQFRLYRRRTNRLYIANFENFEWLISCMKFSTWRYPELHSSLTCTYYTTINWHIDFHRLPPTSADFRHPPTSTDLRRLPPTSDLRRLPPTSADFHRLPTSADFHRPPPTSADFRPPPTSTDFRPPPTSTDLRRLPPTSDLRRLPPTSADFRRLPTSADFHRPPPTSDLRRLDKAIKDLSLNFQVENTPDCFDGKESSRLGNNCNLEFKIGNLWVTKCLNVTTPITNISEFEVQLVHVCNEIYCYRSQRKVNQSLCKIRIGVPFLTRIANYAGNMTWQQGFDYCLGMGLPFREIYSSYLDDFGQPLNGLRRLDHPAYIHLLDAESEGTWLDHVDQNVTEKLFWDPNPAYHNSEDRDYGAVNGSFFQAYGAIDTGPDVLCSKSNDSWIEFVSVWNN